MPRPLRLLLVDDEPTILELLTEYLSAWGHHPLAVREAGAAMDLLEEGGIDVVLADLDLPDATGLELLEAIRRHPDPPATILMAGCSSTESAVRALKGGASDYLLKPFRLEEVRVAIERAARACRRERGTVHLDALLPVVRGAPSIHGPGGLPGLLHDLLERSRTAARAEAAVLLAYEPGPGRWNTCAHVGETDWPEEALASWTMPEPGTSPASRELAPGVLLLPLPVQVDAGVPPAPYGALLLALPSPPTPSTRGALELAAGAAGAAVGRVVLAERLRMAEGEPPPGYHAGRPPGGLEERVRELLARAADHPPLALSAASLVEGLSAWRAAGPGPSWLPGRPPLEGVAGLVDAAIQYDLLTRRRAWLPLVDRLEAAHALEALVGTRYAPEVVELLLERVSRSS